MSSVAPLTWMWGTTQHPPHCDSKTQVFEAILGFADHVNWAHGVLNCPWKCDLLSCYVRTVDWFFQSMNKSPFFL